MTDKIIAAADDRLHFTDAMRQTSQLLDGLLLNTPQVIRRYTAHLAASKGKMLRAASVLTCAQGEDHLIPASSVLMAAAIELVHLATLVHDDVIDEADIRRGKPTLRKVSGNKIAVICGDYLLSQAIRLAASIPDRNKYFELKFQDHLASLCLGELSQLVNNNNFSLTPLQYFRIINGKTAVLFEAAFLAGALISGESAETCRLYGRLGHYTGMIFQLTDDCLDYESDQATAGKDVQTDYEQSVITLPLIFAMMADPGFKSQLVTASVQGHKLARPEIQRSVLTSGGLVRTHRVAQRYGAKAEAVLSQLNLSSPKTQDLALLLKKALRIA